MPEKLTKKIILGILGAVSLGAGIFSLTKEGIEKITKVLIQKGKLAEPEAKKLAKEIIKRAKKERKLLEEKTKETTKSLLKALDVPTRKEIQEIKKKIKELSKKIK